MGYRQGGEIHVVRKLHIVEAEDGFAVEKLKGDLDKVPARSKLVKLDCWHDGPTNSFTANLVFEEERIEPAPEPRQ